MATTAWKFPGSAKSVSRAGSVTNWGFTGNIVSDNGSNSVASFSLADETAHLVGYDFGFTSSDIPDNAIITGIEVQAGISYFSSLVTLRAAAAAKNASAGSPTMLNAATAVNTALTSSEVLRAVTVGATELFGTTWTAADIHAAGFGVSLWCSSANSGNSVNVDYIQARVNFIAASSNFFMFF